MQLVLSLFRSRIEHMQLVLSLFPGIGLLDRAFEAEGLSVERGADPAIGTGDIRNSHVPRGKFDGVIGGSPCQDFSAARRCEPTGEGLELLGEFVRLVKEAGPLWWLLENVPNVPTITIPGYTHQRIDLRASEFGSRQRRLRHFQFGCASDLVLCIERPEKVMRETEPCCMATEGAKKNRRPFSRFCQLQGLPADFELPYFTVQARYRAVGNGVPIGMGRAIARGILNLRPAKDVTVCACSCGRRVTGKKACATMACRQRLSRRRRAA